MKVCDVRDCQGVGYPCEADYCSFHKDYEGDFERMNSIKKDLPIIHVCPRCKKPCDRLVSSGDRFTCVECVKKSLREDGREVAEG